MSKATESTLRSIEVEGSKLNELIRLLNAQGARIMQMKSIGVAKWRLSIDYRQNDRLPLLLTEKQNSK